VVAERKKKHERQQQQQQLPTFSRRHTDNNTTTSSSASNSTETDHFHATAVAEKKQIRCAYKKMNKKMIKNKIKFPISIFN
jgi:hypothetical protein